MEAIGLFVIYALTAAFLENAVFTRTLGVGRLVFFGTPQKILTGGSALTVITLLSSLLSYGVNYLLYDHTVSSGARAFLYLCCIAAVYFLSLPLCRYVPKLNVFSSGLALSSFNCAVLGALVLSQSMQNSLAATAGFGLGTGIGYTLALLLVYSGRRSLELISLPRAFKGMPVMLLYIGIVSLAIYGLIGHQLPT